MKPKRVVIIGASACGAKAAARIKRLRPDYDVAVLDRSSYISYAANRRMYGNWMNAIPSRFVDELPEENVEVEVEQGLYGNAAGRSVHWDSSGFVEAPVVRRTSFVGGTTKRIEHKADNPAPESEFSRGDKVMHDKFGRGTIIHLDGHKLDIAFETGGTKRVMDSFIKKV